MRIAVTIDVEEEGLFTGRYPLKADGVTNVARLDKLAWLTRDFGIPLTLLADYPVVLDDGCVDILTRWRDHLGAEIGAHLHPWNTLPLDDREADQPDSSALTLDQVRSKVTVLKEAMHSRLGVTPTSFRMGRWEFTDTVRDAIMDQGFTVDSSVAPLKVTPAGDQFFAAPNDPYFLGDTDLYEVPLTMVPLLPWTVGVADALGTGVKKRFRRLGAVSIQPVWHSLPAMKLAAHLHQARGGQVLTLFFHSSELLPGASPHFSTEASVDAFLYKLRAFVEWLTHRTDLHGCTLSGLRPRERT